MPAKLLPQQLTSPDSVDALAKSFLQSYCQTLILQQADLQISAELCVTLASLPVLQKQISSFLHKEELEYFSALPSTKRQHSYLLGRYASKQAIVRQNPGLLPTDISVRKGVFEQPVVCYPGYQNIQVTISHSKLLGAALAFPETCPMGLDIEFINNSQGSVIATQLTSAENQWINQCKHTPPEVSYALFWTMKEALSKVLRTGMTTPFEIYAIKEVVYHNYYWTGVFENFVQYQAYSFLLDGYLCSIVYPKQTLLIMDTENITFLKFTKNIETA